MDDTGYVRDQYRTPDNLSIRIQTHELYGEPQIDFAEWVLDAIEWNGDERVVDVGCGAGIYVDPVRRRTSHYVAADLSFGMLQKLALPDLPRINLDAQYLPLATGSVDVVLANHMLYHVPDQQAAVAEFARVLRPGGTLLATTNAGNTMAEFGALEAEARGALGLPTSVSLRASLAFTLEEGANLLSRHFDRVVRRDLPGALVFPSPQPVIDYLGSVRDRLMDDLPGGIGWDQLATTLRQILARHIEEHGAFRVHKLTGLFICRNDYSR